MSVLWRVDTLDSRVVEKTIQHREHHYRKMSLSRAWKVATRHARRGVKLHGGQIQKMNWGIRGGTFPASYRIAVIRLEESKS